MIYELERRGTGLAMSASLYNFLIHNKIEYSYNFELGGIEITEDALESIRNDYKADLGTEAIKYTSKTETALKTQNKASQSKSIKREKKRLW